ncbi:MAG: TonB-dependent receptor plug domain-containing protein, partial [Solimonas sp.]
MKRVAVLMAVATGLSVSLQATAQQAADAETSPPASSAFDPAVPGADGAPLATIALAQTDADLPPVPIAKAEPEPPAIDEVLVTVTKHTESVRKIPMSITAIDGKSLEERNARELQDYVNLVPGIKMQQTAAIGSGVISIRGVGPLSGTNQTTGIFLDDVALSDPTGAFAVVDPDPFDMKSVQILKG